MGYDQCDYIPCEIPNCGRKCVDVHHLKARGMGGIKKEYKAEELMGLCREHHIEYGDLPQFRQWLIDIHLETMKERCLNF